MPVMASSTSVIASLGQGVAGLLDGGADGVVGEGPVAGDDDRAGLELDRDVLDAGDLGDLLGDGGHAVLAGHAGHDVGAGGHGDSSQERTSRAMAAEASS